MAIIRGRFATRSFTQVPNHWLRDPRLSYKAKGILAYIASHRADYELSVEQMAAEGREGRDAIQSALRELVAVGYLVRRQRRNPDGTLGGIDYRIVESPTAGAAVAGKSGRGTEQGKQPDSAGQAADGKPGRGSDQGKQHVSAGQTADGFAGDGKSASKKTISQETKNNEEDSLSPPSGPPPPDRRSHPGERDEASPKREPSDLPRRFVLRHGATADEAARVVADIRAAYTPRNNGWWRTVDREGDLGDIVAQALARIRTTPADASTPAEQSLQPSRCGACDPSRLVWVRAANGRIAMAPCPACHRRGKPLPPGAMIVDGPEVQPDITPRPAGPAPACGRPACRNGWYRLGVNRVRCHICPAPPKQEIECSS
ncbi:hypothetical protein ACVCAH_11585 [Micromonospora sp. LZ34]